MFDHAHGQRPLLRALLTHRDSTPVLGHLHDVLSQVVRAELTAIAGPRPEPVDDLLVAYVTGAFLATLHSWLTTTSARTPDEIDRESSAAVFRDLACRRGRRS